MKKNNFRKLLLVIFLIAGWAVSSRAQVTVGDNKAPESFSVLEIVTSQMKGGLRLPQLSKLERDALTKTDLDKFKGLTIYNTDTDCVEYWSKKDEKWISLCASTQGFITTCPDSPILAPGGGLSCSITDPACQTVGEYKFQFISGSEFATLTVVDAGAGAFKLDFTANDRASERVAIIMVISPCGNSQIFTYTQLGDNAGCGVSVVPLIIGENTTGLCSTGAAYLYLQGRPSLGTYIWTLNGNEVGRGVNYIATQSGTYRVYGDKIGCTGSKAAQVTLGTSQAPSPVAIVVNTNNGIVCTPGGTTKLIAAAPATGTVVWYKDGVKTGLSGTSIDATAGSWTAVVEDGTCSSTPSAPATVIEQTGTPVTMPTLKINGLTSGYSLCQGGSAYLEVNNVDNTLNYTWYADNTQIGMGNAIYFPVPTNSSVVIRLRATGPGCAQEVNVNQPINTTAAPAIPIISGNDVLCGGTTTLSAQTSASTYNWYKNDVKMTEATQNITVNQTGDYSLTVASGSCVSQRSATKTVTLSDFTTLTWVQNPTPVNFGDIKVYEVLATNGPATYNWTVSGGATIQNGQGTNKVQVQFPASGTSPMTVGVSASNACGTAANNAAFAANTVIVQPNCPTPTITDPASAKTISAITGQSVTLSITAANTNTPTYQWYKGTVGVTTTPVGTGASYTYTPSAMGTETYWCRVTNGCTGTPTADSPLFTVNTTKNPADMGPGAGTLTGKVCFDINKSNWADPCGQKDSRTAQAVDFSTLGGVTYTFTASSTGTKTNLHFVIVDAEGCVTSSNANTVAIPGTVNNNQVVNLTVNYKTTLSNTDDIIYGRTKDQAAIVKIYAVYNDGSNDVAVPLTVKIQDCVCCGAATVSGGWLTFMCHNLGADETKDPFTYVVGNADGSGGTLGYLFQWGRVADGHEKRNSTTVAGPLSGANLDANGQVTGTNKGKFIANASSAPYDWRSPQLNTLWGDGTQNENMAKSANDPCPIGWKVPSQKQWASIYTNMSTPNTWTWNGNGYKVGLALFLPAAGYRVYTTAALSSVGSYGYYWSSTVNGAGSYGLYFSNSSMSPAYSNTRTNGVNVRCVSE